MNFFREWYIFEKFVANRHLSKNKCREMSNCVFYDKIEWDMGDEQKNRDTGYEGQNERDMGYEGSCVTLPHHETNFITHL